MRDRRENSNPWTMDFVVSVSLQLQNEKEHAGPVVKMHGERMQPKVTREKPAAMVPVSRTHTADIERGRKMPSVEVRLAPR